MHIYDEQQLMSCFSRKNITDVLFIGDSRVQDKFLRFVEVFSTQCTLTEEKRFHSKSVPVITRPGLAWRRT